uniref:Pre-rRNA-processing protein TSR1 homolog n=1 Tax=Panagrellus redivivus TaxID=6233 RepID=A0A7E4VKB0_PANRE
MSAPQAAHRPGAFKLPNKQHKAGRHRTKGQIDRENKGRQDAKSLSLRQKRSLSRNERRKVNRHERLVHRRRINDDFHNKERAPYLVTVISFSQELDAALIVERLASADPEASVLASERGNITYLHVPRFRARYGFVCPILAHTDNVLDCLKVSDIVLFAWPANEGLTDEQGLLMSTILAHGFPTAIHLVSGIPSKGKQRDKLLANVKDTMKEWNFVDDSTANLDTEQDGFVVLRNIQGIRKKPTLLQRRRPHLLVEKMERLDAEKGFCTLALTGFLRGPALDANRLVHIQGLGDFQLSRVDRKPDPVPGAKERIQPVSFYPDETQADLVTENTPDPMDAEQPDVEDLLKSGGAPTVTAKVPKGTSSYQAAWITASDDEEEQSGEDDDEDDSMDSDDSDEEYYDAADDVKGPGFLENEGDAFETATMASEAPGDFEDMEIDTHEVEKYRQERENVDFPDEVDTPLDQPAAVRFQKYRGLKSFRTSPWDPKENLPFDYARIFKFQNIKHTRKQVLAEIEKDPTPGSLLHGDYVTLYVKNVPSFIYDEWGTEMPMVVYGLLRYEQKMSVLNVVLRRHPSCDTPIKSKEMLIYHVGYRRFEAGAVFSQHTNGNKFKMERFMPTDDGPFVASMYAPIMFGPAPVLVFRRDQHGNEHLVARGTTLDVNPDRVIVKRVVLSGHPSKVNKRAATVKYMFFNRDDIEWFKPIEVYTPQGRRGHIKEALGTHGVMKCMFDNPLTIQDAVLMNLYKRAFPKWTYNPRVTRTKVIGGGMVNSHSLISLVTSASASVKGVEKMEH